jgi:hypothetical protein
MRSSLVKLSLRVLKDPATRAFWTVPGAFARLSPSKAVLSFKLMLVFEPKSSKTSII